MINKNGAQSQSVLYIYNVYISTRSDVLGALYFLDYFESELFYRVRPFIKNVSFVETQKNVIYSKLVNNPFKDEGLLQAYQLELHPELYLGLAYYWNSIFGPYFLLGKEVNYTNFKVKHQRSGLVLLV